MADTPINSAADLRAEIVRLRLQRDEQRKALAERFSSPLTTLSTLYTIFPSSRGEGSKYDIFHQDIVGIISRILLPFTLNKTVFRNSNFLVKTLVSLVSQKASRYINEDTVTNLWDKIRSVFEKKEKNVDYGIPPDSEAS